MNGEGMSPEEGFSRLFTECFAKTTHAHEFLVILGVNANPGQEQQNYAAVLYAEGKPSKEGYLRKEDFQFSRSSTQSVKGSEIEKMRQNAFRQGIGSIYLPAPDVVEPGAEIPAPDEMRKLVDVHFDKAAEGFLMSYLQSTSAQERMLAYNVGASRRKNVRNSLEGLSQEERLGRLEELCGRIKDVYMGSLAAAGNENRVAGEFLSLADEAEMYRGLLPNGIVDTLVEMVKPQRNIYSANAEWVTNKCMVSSLKSFIEWAREYCALDESNAAVVGRLREELDEALAEAFPIGSYDRTTPGEALTDMANLCDLVTECFETEDGAGTDKLINDLDFLLDEAKAYRTVLPYGAVELLEQVVRPVPNIFSQDSPWVINQNLPKAMEAYKRWLGFCCRLSDAKEPAELKRRKDRARYWRKKVDAATAGGLAVE